jgi:putative membrane-bound dehydrogenase-like protein
MKGYFMASQLIALTLPLILTAPAPAKPSGPRVPPGFKVELVLQAPAIEAPTALCVAPNGDVYFGEDPMDMVGPPTKNADRIWLLKGGDPKKKILIADKMWAVMGLEVVCDKLYVVHAPHVTVFTLDKDGKAKSRKDLFTDLGPKVAGQPSFNDHIPSGIRMGMDGWLYVSIGDKGIPKMTRKEKDQGSVHVAEGRERRTKNGNHISLEGGGVIRFRPDGSGLEVFASGTRNHLDVPMDAQDRIFVRDNTDDGLGWNTRFMYVPPGGFMGYPWAYKQRPHETLPMIYDFGGGSPCGGWVYADDGLPETHRGRVFHCEWGKGKVFAVKVAPDGAGFKYVDEIKFVDPEGTGVQDFRPFTLRPTADGRGFYITDWGYSGWLNPKKAGRIWKVTYVKGDVKPAPRGKDTDSVEQLIKSLNHPAHSERLRAQRALIAKGKAVGPALEKLLRRGKSTSRAKRHVLWVLREIDLPQWVPLTARLAGDKDATVRLQAVRVLATFQNQEIFPPLMFMDPVKGPAILPTKMDLVRDTLFTRLSKDADAQVRLHAAIALAGKRFRPDGMSLLTHLEKEKDRWVRFAIVRTLKRSWDWRKLAIDFLEEDFLKGRPRAQDALCWALTEEYTGFAVNILRILATKADAGVRKKAVEAIARVHHDRKPYAGTWWGTQPAAQKPPARVVAWEWTPVVREALLKALADKDAGVRKAAVNGLVEMNDPQTLDPLVKQFAREADSGTRTDIVRAVSGLKGTKAADFLGIVLLDAKNPDGLRQEAIAGLERMNTAPAAASIAKVVSGSDKPALRARALQALGLLKGGVARKTCAAALKSRHAAVRQAAVSALAKIGGADVPPLLLPLLEDRDSSVRLAVIQAVGTLQARAGIPALIRATASDATQFEASVALTRMPDKRALSAYLTGLGSKNNDLRTASRQAIAAIREEVTAALEQLVKGNEVRAELLPELRSIFSSFSPLLSWRLIGPFPNDGKAFPPEKELKFDAVYQGEGKKVKWSKGRGDGKNHGKVNLLALYQPNTNVVAYGYAEIDATAERDARLLIGSDDSIVVWLNGKKVHEFPGDRAWAFDQDKVNVKLKKGKNRLLIKCGQHGGFWEFSVAVSRETDRYAFLKGGGKKYDLEAFRAFARKNRGDAERGRKLFLDIRGLACVKCHAVSGNGGTVGPDLAGIGLKYKREDLMTSILEPSKTIAQGYETIVITTKKGQILTGVFKGETGDSLSLMDKDGKKYTVPKKQIDEKYFSTVSTMPNGLNEGMTLQDFADLIAFLEARREEEKKPKKR